MANYYVSGYTPPVGVGDKSGVKQMQQQLNASGAGLKIDGIWGPKTQAAYDALNKTSISAEPAYTQAANDYASGFDAYLKKAQAMIQAPTISYTPQSEAALLAQIEGSLRPGVNQAIAQRQKQTYTNRAEIDADAYARGMGSSTYVTDVKDRQMDAEADDITTMEGNYAAAVSSALGNAIDQERARALQVEQYNAAARQQADQLAFSLAQSGYSDYLTQQQAEAAAAALAAEQAAKKSSRKGGKKPTEPENIIPQDQIYWYLSVISPEERSALYYGESEDDAACRQEVIDSLGKSGFVEAQGLYPPG